MNSKSKKQIYFEKKIQNLFVNGKVDEAEQLIQRLGEDFSYLSKTNSQSQNKNTDDSRKKIAFFSKGDDKFLWDIINELSQEYEVKKITITKNEELKLIDEWMAWSDISWFEWCDELVVYGSKLPIANYKKVICRLHSYEAFTNYPLEVNWQVIDKLICVADHIKQFILKKINIDRDKLITMPNGVDLKKWNFKNRKSGNKIAYVGYVNYKKGPMLMLQIFKKLYDISKSYKFYIAGEFQDERDFLYFKQMVKEFGLESNIFFSGWQNNLDNWLENKDYIICTSILESQNMSVMEAMAKGIKPIIHNFVGAKNVYDKTYLWHHIDEAIEMIQSNRYSSSEYRKFIHDYYSLENQLKKIKLLIKELEAKKIPEKIHKTYNSHSDLSCVPFFIIGSGRSGNTLLRAMLTSHSKLAIPPESYVLPVMYDVFMNFASEKWGELVEKVLDPLENYPDFYTWGISLKPVKETLKNLSADKRTFAKILDEVYLYYASVHFPGAKIWGDKTPLNTFNLNKIDNALPNSRYIHIIRDGRDVVNSYMKAGFYDSVEKASWRWLESIKKAIEFSSSKDSNQFLEVRYEDLVHSPGRELKKICNFLEIPFESNMLEFYKIYDKLGDSILSHHKNVKNPVNKKSIGKWKRELNKKDQAKVNHHLASTLKLLNY